MHSFSTVPLLAAALAVFWLSLALRGKARGLIGSHSVAVLALWLLSLFLWAILTNQLARNGTYTSAGFLALLPGLWWPLIPVAITGLFLLIPAARHTALALASAHPRAFTAIQSLRILAIGGVIKGFTGKLPPSFALPVGLPDLGFGLFALFTALTWPRRTKAQKIALNLLGIAVILPAPVLMQTGLPGPVYLFQSQPDARALLASPMVIAPTLIVPMFFLMNALNLLVLWRKPAAPKP